MKTSHCILILACSFICAHPAMGLQSVAEPSEARQKYLLELKSVEDRFQEAISKSQLAESMRDRLLDVNPPTARELKLADQIAELEDVLADKELIADPTILSVLTAKRVELLIDIAGLTTRQELSLNLEIEQRKAESEKNSMAIEAAKSYLELAMKKRNQLAELRDSGNVSQIEFEEAEHGVAMAKLQLVEKERDLAAAGASDPRAEVHLSLAEKKSQLEVVEKLLTDASSIRGDIKRLADLKAWLNRIKESREYGTVAIMRDYEKDLAEQKLRVMELRDQLEELKSQKPD